MWKVASSSRGENGPADGPGLGSAAQPWLKVSQAVNRREIETIKGRTHRPRIIYTLSELRFWACHVDPYCATRRRLAELRFGPWLMLAVTVILQGRKNHPAKP